ncbi:MAG: DNA-processing protein DprA [Rubrivivax sp.]|nr:DNA-processing protein DprA [Rubrivivax sp.]
MAERVDPVDREAWLRLILCEGLGRATARRLLAAFGSADGVLRARPQARQRAGGPHAEALDIEPPTLAPRLAAALAWLDGGDGRALWTLGDPAYPLALMQTADPPLALFADGDPAWLAHPMLAIVGSRNATAQGLDHARAFARHFSDAGWSIVSGLAGGIDGAAHQGALAGSGGTVAVVGTGPDIVYPARHRALAAQIRERGLILSEYAPGTPALPLNFPRRNRIIAGLGAGTLVVEATLQSGSLITARLAAEAGREVFAIPGSIHSPQSRGCHALIRQGAKLVESAQDMLDELGAPLQRSLPLVPTADEAEHAEIAGDADALLAALGHDPVTLDALSARTGWDVSTLNVKLLEHELAGRVARLPGGLFQRRAGV